MPYLTVSSQIRGQIAKLASAKTLWVDTEIADFNTENPQLSLIQVTADYRDLTGDRVYIFDVLDQPELSQFFISQIMVNSRIEKVFHNAKYDLKFLGDDQAKNVTCTLEMAKNIPYYLLPVPNYQLKTLVKSLCNLSVDKSEQTGNWGQRLLTDKQLQYAKMDVIYLVQVDQLLRKLTEQISFDPVTEDLTLLTEKYQKIESEWQPLDVEISQIKEKIKEIMQTQELEKYNHFHLSSSVSLKVDFSQLAQLTYTEGIELDFWITLTKDIQKQLGRFINDPSLEIAEIPTWRLTVQNRQKSPRKNHYILIPEDLSQLNERYQEIESQWKLLDTEFTYLKERVKKAMQVQDLENSPNFKLANSPSLKVKFSQLAELTLSKRIELKFPVTLTKEIQEKLGNAIGKIAPQVEATTRWSLITKREPEQNQAAIATQPLASATTESQENEYDDLPF